METGENGRGFSRGAARLTAEGETGENGSTVCRFPRKKSDSKWEGKQGSRREKRPEENATLSQGPLPVAEGDLSNRRSLPLDGLGEKMAAYGVFGVSRRENSSGDRRIFGAGRCFSERWRARRTCGRKNGSSLKR